VQLKKLIADLFVAVYNQIKIISHITDEIIYFAASSSHQYCLCVIDYTTLDPTKNSLDNKYLRCKYKYKYCILT